jgi:hypothetical protein
MPSSRRWRGADRNSSVMPPGFATCCLDHHPIGHGWPIVWMRLPGDVGVELATRWEAEAELEALQTLAARVRGLVLDDADGPSSLVVSMSMPAEQL